MIRPGPKRLPPGRAPGGVVFHVYDVPTQRLLSEQLLAESDGASAFQAGLDVSAFVLTVSTRGEVCIVAYDGDTGERYTRDELVRIMDEGDA